MLPYGMTHDRYFGIRRYWTQHRGGKLHLKLAPKSRKRGRRWLREDSQEQSSPVAETSR